MTPTSMRVDVSPVRRDESRRVDSSLDDVWTNGTEEAPQRKQSVVLQRTVEREEQRAKISRRATEVRPKSRIDDFESAASVREIDTHFDGVEVSARVGGRLVDVAVLRQGKEQYILGHRTPQGTIAPAKAHLGLRLLRINDDRTVDLVFPRDAAGELVRGDVSAEFRDLTEGRKYSCLRLEARDVATVILGDGKNAIAYHIRFLRRPKSLVASLRKAGASA